MVLVADGVAGNAVAVVDDVSRIGLADITAVRELQIRDADQLIGAFRRTWPIVSYDNRNVFQELQVGVVDVKGQRLLGAILVHIGLGDRVLVAEARIDGRVVVVVIVAAAIDRIVAAAADEQIIADAAQQEIATGASIERVVACVAVERVTPSVAEQGIFSVVANEAFVAGIRRSVGRIHDSNQRIVAEAAIGRVVSGVDDVIAAFGFAGRIDRKS